MHSFTQRVQKEFLLYSPWQDLPAWQWVMWLRTFFMVRQWGRLHCRTSPLACSRRWHLWAWRRSTSCCWMSLRFSGSAVGGAPAAAGAAETWVPGPTRPAWLLGTIPGAPPTGAPEGPPTPVCDCWDPWWVMKEYVERWTNALQRKCSAHVGIGLEQVFRQ